MESNFWDDVRDAMKLLENIPVVYGYTVSPDFYNQILKECFQMEPRELGSIRMDGLIFYKVEKQSVDCIEWTDSEKLRLYTAMAESQFVTAEMLENFWIKKEE